MKQRFSDGVDAYLRFREANGLSPQTIRQNRYRLTHALTVVGNIYIENINSDHITSVLLDAAKTRDAGAMRGTLATLNKFFEWCIDTKRIRQRDNPMVGHRAPRVVKKERLRLSVGMFPALLDAAESLTYPPPAGRRDRIFVAAGIYTLKRAGEIRSWRIGDLSLADGGIKTVESKPGREDFIPISEEFDVELRNWLEFYASHRGPLDLAWFLIPSFTRPVGWGNKRRQYLNPLRPVPVSRAAPIAKRALEGVGFPVVDVNGKASNEGMHTLRRSAARALFDSLRDLGYDGALRVVQAMLGHATVTQTEHYIGLTLDRVHRDELIRGKAMYPALVAPNVRRLSPPSEREVSSG